MLKIRLLKKTDWQGLYELVDKVDKRLVGMYSETKELVEDWINALEPGLWEIYVATLPDAEIKKEMQRWKWRMRFWKRYKPNPNNLVGLVTFYGDYMEDEDLKEGEFDIGITVAKPFQKRGIGKALLDFICKRGQELCYQRATLWTRVDNHAMINLAKKAGFKEGLLRQCHGYLWKQFIKELKGKEKESGEH